MKKLDEMQIDALRELASISSGNASTTLSKLTGKMVKLTTSYMNVIEIEDLPKFVGGPKKLVVGIYIPVAGDISGTTLMVFPKKSALILSDLMQKKELGTSEVLKKKDQRMLIKTGDITSTTYLNALAGFLGIKATRADPKFVSTFGEYIDDFILLGVGKELKHALLLKTTFSISPPKIEGQFIMLLAVKSLDLLLNLIKAKLGG